MAFEYIVLGQQVPDYRVEPWTPVDSLAWLKAMAWDLRGNYDDELTRARLAGSTSRKQLDELFPAYPYATHQPILSAQDWQPRPPATPRRRPSATPDLPAVQRRSACGLRARCPARWTPSR